jgi:hypothetical protein
MRFKDRWMRHAVAISSNGRPVTRSFERHTKSNDGKTIVKVQVEEVVYAHDVYRKKIDGKKKADPILWHRGAKVGTV